MNLPSGNFPLGGRVLILDRDATDRRFVEIGLAKTGRFTIEAATAIEAALEILRAHVIDLVLTEVELADGDAFQLLKRVRARPGGKDLPVIFVTKDKRGSVLTAALQSGAVDFVAKPYQLTELLARCDAVITRYRERRLEAVARGHSLAGELGTIAFPDLLHLLEIGNREGQLFFTTERGVGEIKLQKGRVVDASFGSVEGEPAFYALMREERGRFEFQPGALPSRLQRTITLPTTTLLMEGARQLDMHKKAGAAAKGGAVAAPVAAALVAPAADVALELGASGALPTLPRALPASPAVAAELAAVIEDAFALGELRYLTRSQLAQRTQLPGAAQRCVGVLVAPTLAGVHAFVGMAAPLGEEDIASALEWDQRVLMLTMTGARGSQLDLLLFDCAVPAMVLDEVRCAASFVVYAPPHGDHLRLPHHSIGELVGLLGRLRPEVLMGLGNAAIVASIEQLCLDAKVEAVRVVAMQPLEDPGSDFRAHLAQVLAAWGKRMVMS